MMSEALLVDTDVFSFMAWRRPLASDFLEIVQGRLLAVSFASVGELHYGAVKRGWGPNRLERLESALRPYVVVPGTYEIARQFGDIMAAFRDQFDERDMWVNSIGGCK